MPQEVILQDDKILRWCGGHQEYHDPDDFSPAGGNGWCIKYRAKYYQTVRRAKRFGLTPDELEALYEKQENKCAICDAEVKLHIDHDHETGRVRGLLCQRCNMLLGWYEQQPFDLTRITSYLELP